MPPPFTPHHAVAAPPSSSTTFRRHLSDAQVVELTAAIAQENFRARFKRPFKVSPVGFSAGRYCPLPEGPTRD